MITKIYDNRYMFLAFLLSAAFSIIPFLNSCEISVIPDSIGTLGTAAKLAGLDWSGIMPSVRYYGFGYTVIFTPLLKATSNPYIIAGVIYFVNLLACWLVSFLIYRIATGYLGWDDCILTAVFTAICSMTRNNLRDISNEYPLFVCIWVAAFLLAVLSSEVRVRKFRVLSGLLAVVLAYSLTVHERALALVIAVVAGIFVYHFLFKKALVSYLVFLPALAAGYICKSLLRDYVVETVWGTTGTVTNMNAIESSSMDVFENIHLFASGVDGIVSNFYKMAISSYGAGIFALLAALFLLVYYLRHRNRRPLTTSRELPYMDAESRRNFMLLFIFGLAVLVVIVGLGTKESNKFYTGTSYKALFYLRYYQPFMGPALLAVWKLIPAAGKKMRAFLSLSPVVFTACLAYLSIRVFPRITDTDYFGKRTQFSPILQHFVADTGLMSSITNIAITAVVVSGCIWLLMHFHKKIMQWAFAAILGAFLVIPHISGITGDMSLTYTAMDATYALVSQAEGMPDELYAYDNGHNYQFALSHHTIRLDWEGKENIILLSTTCLDGELASCGYPVYAYQLDEDEYIYAIGEEYAGLLGEYVP